MHQRYSLGILCERMLKIFDLLLSNYLISTYLNHPKINLNCMLALNFGVICLCTFKILVEVVKDDEGFPIYLDVQILY